MRYREGLPLSLRGFNATIRPGERVGIVGRTVCALLYFLFSVTWVGRWYLVLRTHFDFDREFADAVV